METYHGHVRSPADAIILFEACRMGLLPRVQRRLSEKERQSIRSGSVFVWDEREAGMRRWTDGKSWSASRVSGSFLTYREMEGRRAGVTSSSLRGGRTPESTRGSDDDRGEGADGSPDGYRYKPDGLMKQSFSISTSTGQHLHLISYYSRNHPSAANLQQPSTDPNLRHVRPQKGLYPESTVNDQQNLPVVTKGPMPGVAYYPMSAPYSRATATQPQSYPYGWSSPAVPVTYPSYPPQLTATNSHLPYGSHHHQLQAPPPPPPSSSQGLPPLPPTSAALGGYHHPSPYDRPDTAHHYEPPAYAAKPPHSAAPPIAAYPTRSPPIHETHPQSPPRMYVTTGIDPRLTSTSVPTHVQSPASSTTNGTTTYSPHSAYSPHHHAMSATPASSSTIPPQPLEVGRRSPSTTSSSATVPSIGTLMNTTHTSGPPTSQSARAHASPPTSLAQHPTYTTTSAPPAPRYAPPPPQQPYGPASYDVPTAVAAPSPATPSIYSSFPRTGSGSSGPRDIPSEKMKFRAEDSRALRQLDRVFI